VRARGAALVALAAALGAPAAAADRPPVVGVSHLAFRVSDLGRARAVYGGLLGYAEGLPRTDAARVTYAINPRQYVEVLGGLPAGQDERLDHVAFETTDLDALRAYLEGKGVKSSEPAPENADRVLRVTDPDGHPVEFVEHAPGSVAARRAASPPASALSARLLHVGLTVRDQAAADRFYKDVLGFSEIWRGGRTDEVTDWVNMKVPEGTDYLEYMLVSGPVDRQRLGTLHHMALLVPDIQAALEALRARPGGRDAQAVRNPQVGRNNRWQLNLYDADGSRTELMEPYTMR
jgi:lactoylglutathione lyase